VHTLLDCGADSDFISRDIADQLKQQGALKNNNYTLICIGLGDQPLCAQSLGTIKCKIQYEDENNFDNVDNIEATIIESNYDVILGRKTIKKLNLVEKFPSHFKDVKPNKTNTTTHTGDDSMMSGTDCRSCSLGSCQCQQPEVIEMLNVLRHKDEIQTIEQIATSKLSSEERDDDGIDDDDLQVFPFELFTQQQDNQLPHCSNENDQEFNQQIHQVCEEFKHIFSKTEDTKRNTR
jgi:hypothetical protein